MLIPSTYAAAQQQATSLSRGMNANSQLSLANLAGQLKSIKRDEC